MRRSVVLQHGEQSTTTSCLRRRHRRRQPPPKGRPRSCSLSVRVLLRLCNAPHTAAPRPFIQYTHTPARCPLVCLCAKAPFQRHSFLIAILPPSNDCLIKLQYSIVCFCEGSSAALGVWMLRFLNVGKRVCRVEEGLGI
jgi:hypothetical protein